MKQKESIKQAGLKVTMPRVKILEILEQDPARHMSAEEMYQSLINMGEEIGLATVYRVLTQFEEAQLVIRHRFEEGHCVFELNRGEHHDHIVCVRCGQVEEFLDPIIEERQESIARQMNYKITDHSLYLYGICGSCQGATA